MVDVTLTIGGARHEGWKSAAVTLSMESLAGTFDLTVSERWPGQAARRVISPGAAARLAVDGETVITGYVDEVSPSFDAKSHEVSVRGRDAAADLVDCAGDYRPGEWMGLTLAEIAARLASPFGIAVRDLAGAQLPFAKFTAQQGETVFEAISRACRMRAVLAISDGGGGLILTRAGATDSGARLTRDNMLSASGLYSTRERHNQYIVKGQESGGSGWGETVEPVGKASDPAIKRHRPLVILAEEPADGISLDDRAAWEASTRAGRSRRISVTLQGWRSGSGRLWRPNETLHIADEWLDVDRRMMIAGVTFRKDARAGSTADLELVRPEAFDILPLPETEDVGW